MANDNNKINELAPFSDDDPTAEFEIPVLFAESSQVFGEDAGDDDITGEHSIAVLQTNLISSEEYIENLQIELEAARTRSKDLERELCSSGNAVHESETQIEQLQSLMRSMETELDLRHRRMSELEYALDQSRLTATKSIGETDQFRSAAKQDRCRIFELEKQIKSSSKKLAAAERKLRKTRSNRGGSAGYNESPPKAAGDDAQLEQAFAELKLAQQENEELLLQIDASGAQLHSMRSNTDDLREQLAARIEECDQLRTDSQAARQAPGSNTDSEKEKNQELIARQSGLLSGYTQEIRDLKTRIGNAEEYANDLRQKLQIQTDVAEQALHVQQHLQASLEDAHQRIHELTESLDASGQQVAHLEESARETASKYSQENQRLKLELDAALETLAAQNGINEQLLSDLYDNKGFRQALEQQLSETEDKFDKKLHRLEQKANRLVRQADDYEHKLKHKDDAITALMNELANRSSKIEAIGDIENAIQQLDDREASQRGDQVQLDRERVTRLLVGDTEGRELRFPLFKSRLTIGRTADNDIQLNAQFISRRHAVIITEASGTRIVDWGSKNGVYINETRIAEQLLRNGDILTIGATDFRYEERPKR